MSSFFYKPPSSSSNYNKSSNAYSSSSYKSTSALQAANTGSRQNTPSNNTKMTTSPWPSQGKKESDNKLLSEQNVSRELVRASGNTLTNHFTGTAIRSANQVGRETKPFLPDEYYQKIDNNIANAIAARDAEIARIQSLSKTQQSVYPTVASGVDLRTGEVFVGAKNSKIYKGQATCVEDIVHRGLGGDQMSNIIMTPAVRPRNNQTIPVCDRCQTKYPKNQFVKGTQFDELPAQAAKTADTAADAARASTVKTADTVADAAKASTVRNAATDIAEDAAKSGARSGLGRAAKVGGKALSVLGYAMDAKELYDSYQSDGGKIGENTVTSAGGIAGSWAGGALGAKGGMMGGAAIGTMICPGVGTVVGGLIGSLVGGIAGGLGGRWAGEKVAGSAYNSVVSN